MDIVVVGEQMEFESEEGSQNFSTRSDYYIPGCTAVIVDPTN
jgi:hypothetical protein